MAAASLGELVVVLGDLHIPHRALDLPEQFKQMLRPNRIQHIVCTGNLCSKEQLDFLKQVTPSVHVVRGDFDEDASLPEEKVLQIGDFKIGLCHGHQVVPWGDAEALGKLQRKLDVDILITGHTHETQVYEMNDKLFLNPGSATGAFSPRAGETTPTFILMAINGPKVVTWVYQYVGGAKPKTEKAEFTKK